MKNVGEASFIPTAEWVRRLAEETAAFEVAKVVEPNERRGDRRQMEWDHVITLSAKPEKRRIDLFVQTRHQLSPQTVLGVFPKLKWVPPDGILLICAPFISPRVAELCREQNVSYLDGVGNCRIAAPGLFIHVSGCPNRRAGKKAAVDPFSRKSSRIVRTLLKHPDKGWQVQQLAEQADVSLGLVSKVKNALSEEAYLEERERLLTCVILPSCFTAGQLSIARMSNVYNSSPLPGHPKPKPASQIGAGRTGLPMRDPAFGGMAFFPWSATTRAWSTSTRRLIRKPI